MPPSDAARERSGSPLLFGADDNDRDRTQTPRGRGTKRSRSPVLMLADMTSGSDTEGSAIESESTWEYAQRSPTPDLVPETPKTPVLKQTSSSEPRREVPETQLECTDDAKRPRVGDEVIQCEMRVHEEHRRVMESIEKYDAAEDKLEAAIRREEEARAKRKGEARWQQLLAQFESECADFEREREDRITSRIEEVRARTRANDGGAEPPVVAGKS